MIDPGIDKLPAKPIATEQKMKTSKIIFLQIILGAFLCYTATAVAGTFSLPDEAQKGGARLLGEAKDFVSVPFQLENNNLLLTIGVAGAVGLTYVFDEEIRDGFQRSRSRGVDNAADAATLVGDPFLHLGVAALVYGGGILADSPRWKETGEMMGEALILADGATLILKEAVGRGRPNVARDKDVFRPFGFRSDYDGFPSMHTASSFALASVISKTSQSLPVSLISYSAAVCVGLSRLNLNKHWTSDVLMGAAIGELAGWVVTSYHSRKDSLALVPAIMEGGGGLALTGKF